VDKRSASTITAIKGGCAPLIHRGLGLAGLAPTLQRRGVLEAGASGPQLRFVTRPQLSPMPLSSVIPAWGKPESSYQLVPTLQRGNPTRTLQRPEHHDAGASGTRSHAGTWEPDQKHPLPRPLPRLRGRGEKQPHHRLLRREGEAAPQRVPTPQRGNPTRTLQRPEHHDAGASGTRSHAGAWGRGPSRVGCAARTDQGDGAHGAPYPKASSASANSGRRRK
jgi:hypothetical protein